MANKVTVTFAGDTKDLEKAFANVDRAADQMKQRLRSAGTGIDETGQKSAAAAVKANSGASAFRSFSLNAAAVATGAIAGRVALSGLSSAFDFVKEATIGFNTQLQNADIAFTTMLGSGERAKSFLDELKKFAVATPFEFGDLVTASQRMLAMGIAAKDVIPTLTAVGDAVAALGSGKEGVDKVTLALGQMQAKQKIQAEEMLQLTEAGIPAYQILADKLHITVGELQSMMSQMNGGAAVWAAAGGSLKPLIDGLETGTEHFSGFAGMMDKTSHTLTGSLSNISDMLKQAISGAFRPFFDMATKGAAVLAGMLTSKGFSSFTTAVSKGLDDLAKKISRLDLRGLIGFFSDAKQVVQKDLLPALKELAAEFGPPLIQAGKLVLLAFKPLGELLKGIGAAFKGISDFLAGGKNTTAALAAGILAIVVAMKLWTLATTVWTSVTKAATAVQLALDAAMDANPIGVIILAVVGLVAAFAYLWTHSAAFRDFWIGLWNDIWGVLKAIGSWFAGPFADFFVAGWHYVTDLFTGAWNWVKDTFTSAALWVHGKVELFMATLRAIPGNLRAAFEKVFDIITAPFRAAFNRVADAWNSTIGRLSWTVPSWVPFVGGNSISAPHLPHFHSGGIVPGGIGSETLAVLRAGERVTAGSNSNGSDVKAVVVDLGDEIMSIIRRKVGERGGNVQFVLGNSRG